MPHQRTRHELILRRWLLVIALLPTLAAGREIEARRAPVPIVVDGHVTAEEWPAGLFQAGFTQMQPMKGEPSEEVTRVAVQFDDEAVYVAFVCLKSYPDAVVAAQSRRDQLEKTDDVVGVNFDTYHDHRSAYWFMVNGLDTQVDARISDDGKYVDTNWDAGWTARTALIEGGYTVEFAVPFESIRFNPRLETWGINFVRFIPKHLETAFWAGTMDDDFRVSQYGVLKGLETPELAFAVRVIPYTTARYETFSDERWHADAGLDLEARYRNNITTNLTLNPDFATVEGDRERINMTRWELSFPEKRTFFKEGGELFRNRIQAFYSRRIGDIDFGAKAIGKTGRSTFSVIGVKTRRVADNPATSRDEAFPETYQGVFRLKRDVLKSSTVGMMFVNKDWAGGSNRVLSFDGVFHFPRDYHFTTQFVVGMPGALGKNFGGFVRLAKETNIYHVHLRYTELAEDFRESVNGIGFIRDDDRRELDSAVRYNWWMKRGIEYVRYFSNYNIFWSRTQGHLRSWEVIQQVGVFLKNKFSFELEYVRDYQLFEKGFHNRAFEVELGYNTQEWSATELEFEFGRNFDRDFRMVTGSTRFKLVEALSMEAEVRRVHFDPDPDTESTWLAISTLNFQFTPDLYLRLFTQYRSSNRRLYVYGLFGWRFRLPNSAVYFVYTRDDFDVTTLRRRNEVLFLKFAYDFSF